MIDADEVRTVFLDSLYRDGEVEKGQIPEGAVTAEGIQQVLFCFHPGRLASHQGKIKSFLVDLPEEFKEGWSFLNMCMTKDGHQWGEHVNCEELLALGVASGIMEYQLPRELWSVLPGGMPYVRVKEGTT